MFPPPFISHKTIKKIFDASILLASGFLIGLSVDQKNVRKYGEWTGDYVFGGSIGAILGVSYKYYEKILFNVLRMPTETSS